MVASSLRLAMGLTTVLLLFSACGGGNNVTTSPTAQATETAGETKSCEGTALTSSDLKLPSDFPIPGEAILTKVAEAGPSQVVEGYYEADLESAYNEWKEALENAEYTILFDEIEDKDSEISYKSKDETSTGQIALRSECGRNDRTFVHITNRPA